MGAPLFFFKIPPLAHKLLLILCKRYEGVFKRQGRLYLSLTGVKVDKGVSHCHGQVKRDAFF